MKTVKSAAPGRLLTQAAADRRTGAVVVEGAPGGTVYLVDGAVSYAESAFAPGVGELLTASGRLAPRTWRAAQERGGRQFAVGRLLVQEGHLTQGELELCTLGATYDAAYFALSPESGPAHFAEGVRHWLGEIVRIEAAALNRESRRRVRLLDEIHPHPRLDVAAITPVARPPRERVTVTAPQWELLIAADGQRTPADLALLLGRAGYATVQELRRLAAAGLIETPDPVRAEPLERSTTLELRPAAPGPRTATVQLHPPRAASSGDPPAATPQPRLDRRNPGAKLPKELADDPHLHHQGTDEVLLKRIRTALRALR